ncbi:MAG TPA: M23 family metallopeptidase [Geminicoccaceae bacterium]|nr:M23 family metallopeptidase [Geminicoccaceae bacterium]
MLRRSLLLALMLFPASVAWTDQAPPRLALPLDCTPGEDCWIPRHFDHDPGEDGRDYACGDLTDGDHDGTDFAVRSRLAVAEGVAVRAAAAGTVGAVRDGMADVDVGEIGVGAVEGRDCGNGVRVDHGGGFETQYCHLRRGSVVVAPGDRVEAGDPLGMVGMSGMASFPHVHLTVRYRGRAVDPFVGLDGAGDRCGVGAAPLWRDDALAALVPYRPVLIGAAGFAPGAPERDDVRAGYYDRLDGLPRSSPALVVWIDVYGLRGGDAVTFRLTAPDGAVLVDDRREMAKGWARWFGFAGRRRPGGAWPEGPYRGEVAVERAGTGAADGPRRFAAERTIELR